MPAEAASTGSRIEETAPLSRLSVRRLSKRYGNVQALAEVDFELGSLEFEAKGRSVVVERMFRLLLEKIETGKLVAEFKLQDLEEEDDEEEEEVEEELPSPAEEIFEEAFEEDTTETSLDPPPAWDTLEDKEPEVSDAEKEELGF